MNIRSEPQWIRARTGGSFSVPILNKSSNVESRLSGLNSVSNTVLSSNSSTNSCENNVGISMSIYNVEVESDLNNDNLNANIVNVSVAQ